VPRFVPNVQVGVGNTSKSAFLRWRGWNDSKVLHKAYLKDNERSPSGAGTPSPRRKGHRLRRCQTPPPRRHSLRAGALARDTRRLRLLPVHALTRGPPAAALGRKAPSKSEAGAGSGHLDFSAGIPAAPRCGVKKLVPDARTPKRPRPARYTAVAATHAASGTRRRAVAHGHANASVTRGGRIRPLSCPLPTARLRGRRPVIRTSFPSASLFPRFRPRPHRPVCNPRVYNASCPVL
jgi:hypothetical protein